MVIIPLSLSSVLRELWHSCGVVVSPSSLVTLDIGHIGVRPELRGIGCGRVVKHTPLAVLFEHMGSPVGGSSWTLSL